MPSAGIDRRVQAVPELPAIDPADIDPVTDTVRWTRFAGILSELQEQVLQAVLLIDLDERSAIIEAAGGGREADILPLLAQSIRQAIRAEDLISHLHDYKFAVLLPGAPPETASTIANRIQESVDDTLFFTGTGLSRLGVAIGGVVAAPEEGRQTDLIGAATANLGAAKSAQRHIVIQ